MKIMLEGIKRRRGSHLVLLFLKETKAKKCIPRIYGQAMGKKGENTKLLS